LKTKKCTLLNNCFLNNSKKYHVQYYYTIILSLIHKYSVILSGGTHHDISQSTSIACFKKVRLSDILRVRFIDQLRIIGLDKQ